MDENKEFNQFFEIIMKRRNIINTWEFQKLDDYKKSLKIHISYFCYRISQKFFENNSKK